jgi:signal transduction histidine kinase
MVLFTGFAETQVIIYMTSILLITSLINWRYALVLIILGMIVVTSIFKLYMPELLIVRGLSIESKILYIIFLVGGVVIAFLKPRQEYVEDLETENIHLGHEVWGLHGEVTTLNTKVSDLNETVTHFHEKISEKDKEIDRLGATAQRILNNVNHELRLPVGNVMNFAEMLNEGLGKFNESQLKMLSDEVYKNSTRLSSMILNMLDLANLNVKKVSLEKATVNFSEIVKDRVKLCCKIYLQGKKLNFKLAIDPEIMISVDPNYIRQTVDNLVINAINFSEEGTIEVSVHKQKHSVLFTITDQGIGINKNDIYDIFTPFKMGSNTESKAEGRGIGLALCKSVIEAHDGSITAQSDGVGATFRFVLPF